MQTNKGIAMKYELHTLAQY